jgi:hypothetical protein
MPHLTPIPKKISTKRPHAGHFSIAKAPAKEPAPEQGYRGKKTQTGNSQALRFDMALFRSHPEFSGDVKAYVIAPGHMLVVSLEQPASQAKEDPVIASFLSFLAQDMVENPDRIEPLDANLMARVEKLTHGMKRNFDESFPDEELL